MSVLRARIDSEQAEPLWQVARAVFEPLARGDVGAAARGLAPGSEIFGHEAPVALSALGELMASRGLAPRDLSLLPSDDVRAVDAAEQAVIFAGPIDERTRVGVLHLASKQHDSSVSLGVVFVKTASRAWQVQRIFDPIPFATRAA